MAGTQTARRPSPWLLLLEGRAIYEWASTCLLMPLLKRAPRGDGHPVMVLPGYAASDLSTSPLRSYLNELGFSAHRWSLGRNLGPKEGLEERMQRRLEDLHRTYGRKVSLVGWSLGGVYSRILAHRLPLAVRSVITLGSPFIDDPKANYSWRFFELTSGTRIDEVDPATFRQVRQTPPVPTTCFYSRQDGITDWRCCIDQPGRECENIEVPGSHCGLGVNPWVLHAVADRLAQPEGSWKPFERQGLRRYLYRQPHTAAQSNGGP